MGRVRLDMTVDDLVHEALLIHLENLEDSEDLKRIRREPTRPLADVLRDLKLDGRS